MKDTLSSKRWGSVLKNTTIPHRLGENRFEVALAGRAVSLTARASGRG
jgi:hypothetical protein